MSGGGCSGSDGGGDMHVSGMEAAMSTEKGISTHADTRVSDRSFSPGGNDGPQDRGGVHDTRPALGPDTSTVGHAIPDYSGLDQDTGELEKADLSFGEHWANRPENIKWSPALSLLWAGGKNVGEWFKNWGSTTNLTDDRFQDGMRGDGERARMNTVAPHAPYIVSGTTAPSTSPAANWFQNLGTTSTNMGGFNLATEYAAAKAKVAQTLNTPTAVGQLAVNQSPFYSWLQTNSLNKGIL